MDGKIVVGTLATLASVGGSWLDIANAYGDLVLTVVGILVGVATLWYTVERARKMRQDRKSNSKSKDS